MKTIILTVLFAWMLIPSHADFLSVYNFSGGSGVAIVSGTDAGAVTSGTFTPVGGNAALSSFTNTGFLRSSFTGSDEAAALADTDYFSVTLSAGNPGEFLDLNSFVLDFGGSSSDGNYTANIVVQSDVGGLGSGNPTLSVSPNSKSISSDSGTVQLSTATVDISGTEFDQLSSVTFQFRFWDTVSNNNQINRLDNVRFEGAVVPEPSSMLLVLSGVLTFGLIRRGKTRK